MMAHVTRRPVIVFALTVLDVFLFALLAVSAAALGLFCAFGPVVPGE